MAPTVSPSKPPVSGMMKDIAGSGVRSPALPPSPPRSGCWSALPAAAMPLPSNSNFRPMAVTSNWNVRLSKLDINAGLLTTTEASPRAEAEPAMARPCALTLFSRSSNDEPWAAPAAAMEAMARASADTMMCLRGWVFILSPWVLRWFLCVRSARHYTVPVRVVTRIATRIAHPIQLNGYRGRSAPPRTACMFVSIPTHARPTLRWATPALFAVLWLAYLWASLYPDSVRHDLLLEWGTLSGGLAPGSLLHWSQAEHWLRLLTALFLHADWAHLLGNPVFLLIFGLPAERVMGPWRFLALFLVGGAFANFAAALATGTPDRLIIGASGAVSAIIGAYLALFPRARLGVVLPLGLFLEFVRAPASLLIGIWALLQVVFAYVGPAFGAVAWAAHVAGVAFGAVFALASRRAIARRLRRLQGY